jgi:hypothetical protein
LGEATRDIYLGYTGNHYLVLGKNRYLESIKNITSKGIIYM